MHRLYTHKFERSPRTRHMHERLGVTPGGFGMALLYVFLNSLDMKVANPSPNRTCKCFDFGRPLGSARLIVLALLAAADCFR